MSAVAVAATGTITATAGTTAAITTVIVVAVIVVVAAVVFVVTCTELWDKFYTHAAYVCRLCPGRSGAVATEREHAQLGDVFTREDALQTGLSKRRLYTLRDEGKIIALGGGIFRWADAEPADLDLIEIAERVPRATLCLETALARHELIDAIPAAIDIAIPRGSHRPRLNAPARLHHFDAKTFDLGREMLDVGARSPLGIYSTERSLVDAIRLRHGEGADLAWEALRRWLREPGSSHSSLLTIAKQLKGAEAPLRAALEILQ